MRTLQPDDYAREVENRKRSFGVTDEDTDAARNSGRRRTPEKREQLARMQERAREHDLEPMLANF